MEQHKGPHCIAAVLCEQVIEGKDGVLTPIRLVDQTTLTRYTEGQPIAPESLAGGRASPFLQVTLLVQLKSGDYKGRGKVNVKINTPTGKVIPGKGFDVEFLGGHFGANLIFNMALIPEEQGVYWFDVYFEDRLLTRSPLNVLIQESSNSTTKNEPASANR